MFTWICPKCGREVSPSEKDCPNCAAKQDTETAPVASAPPSAPLPFIPRAQVPRRKAPGLPILIFVLAFGGGALAYWAVEKARGVATPIAPLMALQNSPARGAGAQTNPVQRFIEISGIRLTQDPQKRIQARFLVTNHSAAEIGDLAVEVTLWARTAKSDEESLGTFSFKLPSLGPYESKEVTAPLKTKLKVYELPDWQNVTADVQITPP